MSQHQTRASKKERERELQSFSGFLRWNVILSFEWKSSEGSGFSWDTSHRSWCEISRKYTTSWHSWEETLNKRTDRNVSQQEAQPADAEEKTPELLQDLLSFEFRSTFFPGAVRNSDVVPSKSLNQESPITGFPANNSIFIFNEQDQNKPLAANLHLNPQTSREIRRREKNLS